LELVEELWWFVSIGRRLLECASLADTNIIHTLFEEADAVYPGGSGMPADFGFEMGGVLRSTTHCGGGGVDEVMVVDIAR
jgi:hypothetical protein